MRLRGSRAGAGRALSMIETIFYSPPEGSMPTPSAAPPAPCERRSEPAVFCASWLPQSGEAPRALAPVATTLSAPLAEPGSAPLAAPLVEAGPALQGLQTLQRSPLLEALLAWLSQQQEPGVEALLLPAWLPKPWQA